jgi:hypothetical protein
MKPIRSQFISIFLGLVAPAFAQSVPALIASVAAASAGGPMGVVALHDEYAIPLAWNQTTFNASVTVKNTSAKPLVLLGVQSSSGVWVVDYPKVVPANGSAPLVAIVEAKAGAESSVEIVRLKTADGEKTLWLNLNRPPLVTMDSSRLQWGVNAPTVAKSVVLTLSTPSVAIKTVTSVAGHTATFQKRDAKSYVVTITPKSTAKAGSFPIVVTLDPAVPGSAPTITGLIVPKK